MADSGEKTRIKKLTLSNFRGFEQIELEFDTRLTVIAGENGTGKSSVLDAIAKVLLFIQKSFIGSFSGQSVHFLPGDIKFKAQKCVVSVEGEFFGECFVLPLAYTIKGGMNIQSVPEAMRIERLQARFSTILGNSEDLPILVYFGTNRTVLETPLHAINGYSTTQANAYDTALDGAVTVFKLFFEWYRNIEDIENEVRIKVPEYRDRNMEAVRGAIEKITGFRNPGVKRKDLQLTVEKDGQELDIRQMSDGEKCFIALAGDLARRLAIASPNCDNPVEGKGIVMIDEIELHLHPAWQRTVVKKLLDAFPNCQFIVTTHSPQVLGEIDPKHIILLDRDEKTGVITASQPKQSLGLDTNLILESVMGAESKNREVAEEVGEIYRLIDEEKYDAARVKIDVLRKRLHGDTPDLVEAETAMAYLED